MELDASLGMILGLPLRSSHGDDAICRTEPKLRQGGFLGCLFVSSFHDPDNLAR